MVSSLLIHPDELTKAWIDRMADNGITVLGIHPVGGKNAVSSLQELLKWLKTEEFRGLIDYAKSRGLEIEYEFHAAGYLVPRGLFESHPEYFRVNADGERTTEFNFCVSNQEALELCSKRAVEVAKALYGSRPFYYMWLDDRRGSHCRCPKCRSLSPSDQQLTVINSIARALKKWNPAAKIAYLAYVDLVEPPAVKPEDNVFLEYAPMERYVSGEQERIEREWTAQEPLKEVFGGKDMKVLEYWLDNSLFSKWTKPPKPFALDKQAMERDIAHYKKWGAQQIASFACYLGPDYEELHGGVDIAPFAEALRIIDKQV